MRDHKKDRKNDFGTEKQTSEMSTETFEIAYDRLERNGFFQSADLLYDRFQANKDDKKKSQLDQ